jgi:glycosyltransferase involved in cell wall biosynthesis
MISFVVLTLNSGRTIQKCLESIEAQKCEKEIIVVDGGSTDNTIKIAKKYKTKIITDKRRFLGAARNVGLEKAKGKYIAFVDSDVVLPKKWIQIALNKIEKDDMIAGVGGPGISPEENIISDSLNFLYGRSKDTKENYVKSLPTMDLLYKKDAIKNQEFIDNLKAGEDVEYNFRLVKNGYKLLFSSDLFVYHFHPTSLKQMIKKWYNYGRNYAKPYFIHKEMIDIGFISRICYMPLLAFFILLTIILSNCFLIFIPLLQIASLFFAYFLIGIKIKKSPIKFSVIHTLKQLSQLVGITKKMVLRK